VHEAVEGWQRSLVVGVILFILLCALGINLGVRSAIYILHEGDDIVYGRLMGKGRIGLRDIQSIRTGFWGMLTVVWTQRGKVRWYYIMAFNWELLENVVRGAKNATVDILTTEMVDRDSMRRERAGRLVKRIVRFGRIYGFCVAVGMAVWLVVLAVTRWT